MRGLTQERLGEICGTAARSWWPVINFCVWLYAVGSLCREVGASSTARTWWLLGFTVFWNACRGFMLAARAERGRK